MATLDEIKAAHRKLALKCHPDKQKSAVPLCSNINKENDESIIAATAATDHDPRSGQQSNDGTKTRIELNFHRIQEAWECLRDSEKRQEYDHILSRTKENINKERVENGTTVLVNLSEMDVEECEVEVEEEGCNDIDERKEETLIQNVYIYSCRCGDDFEILEEDLRQTKSDGGKLDGGGDKHVFECRSCSLAILVLDDVNEKDIN